MHLDWLNALLGSIAAAALALCGWFVRIVLTNEKKVAVLESKLENMETSMGEVKDKVDKILFTLVNDR